MRMQQIVIQATEDLTNDQETKKRIEERTQKMEEARQFNEHMQPPEGFDCVKEIFADDNAGTDPKARDKYKRTPLHLAA